jgi:hypothetical protein
VARRIDPRNTLETDDDEVRGLLSGADEQDRRYLMERPWTLEEYRRRGFGDEVDELVKERKQAEPTEEPARVTTDDMRQGALPPGPGPQPNGDQVNEDETDDYDEWTAADLKAEVESRNADGRDDDQKMAVSGTKADLIARLRADDEETDTA